MKTNHMNRALKIPLKIQPLRCHLPSSLGARGVSSCSSLPVTHPVESSSEVLRHLEFVNPLPFEKGLQIQEKFVRAQLDMKGLTSKIDRKLRQLQVEHSGAVVNEHEQMILSSILEMKPNPIILTFEFEPTYTGGKRSKRAVTDDDIRKFESFIPEKESSSPSPKFVQVERGGQVTFHGPGQVVAYLIMDLKSFHQFPAKCLVSAIEDSTINALNNVSYGEHKVKLDLKASKSAETGVWIDETNKIASIGIHVRRSITSHGICINVCPDLSYMNNFVMCGLPGTRATSIREQRPQADCTTHDIAVAFVNEIAKRLGIKTVERIQLDDLNID